LLKILFNNRSAFGWWMNGSMDGCIGVKVVLRDCLSQSKNKDYQNTNSFFSGIKESNRR
jgi:hypothetical protein